MLKKKAQKAKANIILILIGLSFVVPTLWLLLSSFDTTATETLRIPKWTLSNYSAILGSGDNLKAFRNSLVIALSSSLISTVFGSIAAYPLSRFHAKWKHAFMLGILLMSVMPMSVAMVAIFRFYVTIGLNDSLIGLVLLSGSMALPYSIWMLRNFFNSVSIDLEEAAWVDGANRLAGLFRVVLPLSAPGLATVFIYNFTHAWSGFYTAFILLTTQDKYPASIMLYQFMDNASGDVGYGRLAAYAVIYTLPAIILYWFCQKYMSRGFSMQGGVKG